MKPFKPSFHSVLSFGLLITALSCKTDIVGPVMPTLTTTDVSAITQLTASTGGTISDDGGATITARGVCWQTSSGPTVSDNNKTSDGTGKGNFISSLANLTPGTTYYVRAYASSKFWVAYGNEVSFTTTPIKPAVLTTTPVTSIASATAQSGGDVSYDGGSSITARGVCWSTVAGPTIVDSKTSDGTGTGNFVSAITNLSPGIKYYARAYATNAIGTSYGNELNFITDAVVATITTANISSIISTSAQSGGDITSDGGSTVAERGVCWSTVAGPTMADSKTSDGTGTGNFVSAITNLSPGIKYYVRAYATNAIGTSYGNELNFTTDTVTVKLTTTKPSRIGDGLDVYSGGTITWDGGDLVIARGICVGENPNPTTVNANVAVTEDGAGTGTFVSHFPYAPRHDWNLYMRAYAITSAGIFYGNEVRLLGPPPPTVCNCNIRPNPPACLSACGP